MELIWAKGSLRGSWVQIFLSMSNCSIEVKRWLALKPPKVSIYLVWSKVTFVGNKGLKRRPFFVSFLALESIYLLRCCISRMISNSYRRGSCIRPWRKLYCWCSRVCVRFWTRAWGVATISNIEYLNQLATDWNQNNLVTHPASSHQYVPRLQSHCLTLILKLQRQRLVQLHHTPLVLLNVVNYQFVLLTHKTQLHICIL